MYFVKEMPTDQRPRERLIAFGAKTLLNEELMAILLRTGTKNKSVLELSKEVLYHLADLSKLKDLSYQELLSIPGIKAAKATTILAAIELGRRLEGYPRTAKEVMSKPLDCYRLLYPETKDLKQEHFIVLYLNVKSQLIKKETIFIGTISQMIIHPREIFKHAISAMSAAVILIHNHPSGDASPSIADIKATEQLFEAGRVLGIDVIDHIILGDGEFYSFKDKNKTYL